MVPTITDRLLSVERALRDVVIPSLPAGEALAIEQAHLSLIQLGILKGQVDRHTEVERDELEAALLLAGELGAATPIERGPADDSEIAASRAFRHAVLAGIDTEIETAFAGASDARRAEVIRAVAAYHRARKPAEDAWFNFSFGSAA